MKTYLLFQILLILTVPLSYSVAKKAPSVASHQGKKFVHKSPQAVAEVLKDPKKYKNKHIQITGTIKKVCPMAGCWIDLEDPKTKKQIHVKVKDGEIVFPKDSVGKRATVEGQFVEKKMSKEKSIKYYKHRAEELGIPFDPKTITGPTSIWEIKGIAAEMAQSKKK